jgi:hypothetical protein
MLKRFLIALLIPALFLLTSQVAKAQSGDGKIVSNGEIAGAIAGAAGAVAVIVFVIYYSIHHGHTLRGCAVAAPGELWLVNESDQRHYELTGETSRVKSGDRVRVSGSQVKGNLNHRQFVVTKLSKDYGACKVAVSIP